MDEKNISKKIVDDLFDGVNSDLKKGSKDRNRKRVVNLFL